ncbi:MAG: ATP synthase F0 subunit B [Acidobacteriia bacterium]|nr:ATP synthase F0 subunit B [Terriglobia bacterium]
MKRCAILALVLCATAAAGFSEGREGGEKEGGNLALWKWANFLVLAGGLGYVLGKNAGPFFAARSLSIRKDIIEADDTRKEAEARAAAVNRRLANLEAEIAALRAESHQEAHTETQRLRQHTSAEMAKIQARAEQEIAAAGKAARLELKRYSAGLAIELAEQKIRARMTPESQDALVRGFVRDLK